jgi:SAM-dependent methyltransferase
VRAARRVAAQLGVEATFVVADARHLPFADGSFDQAFSYSVLQHFARSDVMAALGEVARVLRPDGGSLIQMANRFGVRSLHHQLRRRRAARDFEVRYGTPRELERAFTQAIGPSELSVDGFFSLKAQAADLPLLPLRSRVVVRASETMRATSRWLPLLGGLADSLYISSRRR